MSQPSAAELRRNILNTLPAAFPYAGFWPRVSAHAIDGTAVLVTCYLFQLITMGLKLPAENIWAVNAVGCALISGSYFVLQESSPHQGTFGKRCLGLRVVSAASHDTLSQGQALVRNLYKIAAVIPFLNLLAQIFSLSCFLVLCTQMKQGGADMLSGTVVIAGQKPRLYARFEKAWMLGIFALIVGLPLIGVALGFGSQVNPAGLFGREPGNSAPRPKPKSAMLTPEQDAAPKRSEASAAPQTPDRNPLDDIEAQLQRTLSGKPRNR